MVKTGSSDRRDERGGIQLLWGLYDDRIAQEVTTESDPCKSRRPIAESSNRDKDQAPATVVVASQIPPQAVTRQMQPNAYRCKGRPNKLGDCFGMYESLRISSIAFRMILAIYNAPLESKLSEAAAVRRTAGYAAARVAATENPSTPCPRRLIVIL